MKNPSCIDAFAIRLRELRTENKLSQQKLADLSDIDKKTIQRIEKGGFNPSLETLCSLAAGLGMTLKELMDFKYGVKK